MIRWIRKRRCQALLNRHLRESKANPIDFLLFHSQNNLNRCIGFMEARNQQTVTKDGDLYLLFEVTLELLDIEISRLTPELKLRWSTVQKTIIEFSSKSELERPHEILKEIQSIASARPTYRNL